MATISQFPRFLVRPALLKIPSTILEFEQLVLNIVIILKQNIVLEWPRSNLLVLYEIRSLASFMLVDAGCPRLTLPQRSSRIAPFHTLIIMYLFLFRPLLLSISFQPDHYAVRFGIEGPKLLLSTRLRIRVFGCHIICIHLLQPLLAHFTSPCILRGLPGRCIDISSPYLQRLTLQEIFLHRPYLPFQSLEIVFVLASHRTPAWAIHGHKHVAAERQTLKTLSAALLSTSTIPLRTTVACILCLLQLRQRSCIIRVETTMPRAHTALGCIQLQAQPRL